MGVIAGATAATKAMLALSAASTAIAAAGQIQQSRFQRQQFQQAEEQNRRLAEDAMVLGQERERQVAEQGEALRARQRVGFSSSGFDITTQGTPLETISTTAGFNMLDILNVRRDALMQAQGYEFQARDMMLRRRMLGRSTPFGVGSTFMTGALNATNILRSDRNYGQ